MDLLGLVYIVTRMNYMARKNILINHSDQEITEISPTQITRTESEEQESSPKTRVLLTKGKMEVGQSKTKECFIVGLWFLNQSKETLISKVSFKSKILWFTNFYFLNVIEINTLWGLQIIFIFEKEFFLNHIFIDLGFLETLNISKNENIRASSLWKRSSR